MEKMMQNMGVNAPTNVAKDMAKYIWKNLKYYAAKSFVSLVLTHLVGSIIIIELLTMIRNLKYTSEALLHAGNPTKSCEDQIGMLDGGKNK